MHKLSAYFWSSLIISSALWIFEGFQKTWFIIIPLLGLSIYLYKQYKSAIFIGKEKLQIKTETLNKYTGKYKIVKQPITLKPHNKETWDKIVSFINAKAMKQANFEELSMVADGHLHYGKNSGNPHLFIIYCIRNGWLEKCK